MAKKVYAIHTSVTSALVKKDDYDSKIEKIEKEIHDHINILLLLNLTSQQKKILMKD